jgi:hypothetical protein
MIMTRWFPRVMGCLVVMGLTLIAGRASAGLFEDLTKGMRINDLARPNLNDALPPTITQQVACPLAAPSKVLMGGNVVGIFNDSTSVLRFAIVGADGQSNPVQLDPGEINTFPLAGDGQITTPDNSIAASSVKPGVLYRLGSAGGEWKLTQL